MASKRKHPTFARPNYGRTSRSRIKGNWRRQRGIDNKKRLKLRYMGASPSIGYGQPSEIEHEHPSGLREALVQTPSELSALKGVAVRIASGVGRKKREEIIRVAESMKLPVLNKSKKYKVKIKRVKEADKGKKAEAKPSQQPEQKQANAPAAKPATMAQPEQKQQAGATQPAASQPAKQNAQAQPAQKQQANTNAPAAKPAAQPPKKP